MFGKTLILYIYAETPIHPGSGTTIKGAVDLPIQRERHTEFPIIQASSLKGVLRTHAKDLKINEQLRDEIFGKPDEIGGIAVTDAKILAFPVRSLKGVFGWVTSPIILDRFKRDLSIIGETLNFEVLCPSKDNLAIVPEKSNLIIDGTYVCLEELKLNVDEQPDRSKVLQVTSAISQCLPNMVEYNIMKNKIKSDLVIVSDDVFKELVSTTTELVTRIKINEETGTVEERGLWTEEYLPTDTLMYALILIPTKSGERDVEEIVNWLIKYDKSILQVGGDETIGKGFVRLKVVKGA